MAGDDVLPSAATTEEGRQMGPSLWLTLQIFAGDFLAAVEGKFFAVFFAAAFLAAAFFLRFALRAVCIPAPSSFHLASGPSSIPEEGSVADLRRA